MTDKPPGIPEGCVPYVLDIQIHAWRIPPPYSNRAAPEMTSVARAATRAACRIVEDAGFIIETTGHGSNRTDSPEKGGS